MGWITQTKKFLRAGWWRSAGVSFARDCAVGPRAKTSVLVPDLSGCCPWRWLSNPDVQKSGGSLKGSHTHFVVPPGIVGGRPDADIWPIYGGFGGYWSVSTAVGVGGGSPLVPLSRGGVGVGRGRVRSRENEISAVVCDLISNGPVLPIPGCRHCKPSPLLSASLGARRTKRRTRLRRWPLRPMLMKNYSQS